jgi:hypothetical protein
MIGEQKTLVHRVESAGAGLPEKVQKQTIITIQTFAQSLQADFSDFQLGPDHQKGESVDSRYVCDAGRLRAGA